MPNLYATDCENFVRLVAGSISLPYFKSRFFSPFILYPPPEGLSPHDRSVWILHEYGVRYMCAPDDGPIQLTDMGDGTLGAIFTSSGVPPLAFYRHLVGRFPDLEIMYEYNHRIRRMCGFGSVNTLNVRSTLPKHEVFETPADLEALRQSRSWVLQLQGPPSWDLMSDVDSPSDEAME